mmetsp:Transcript_31925/g.42150  ORF Transcript_31925/g.42150 Transcript_31925/m.42150 type:complete len:121 (-) Transcript_31925:145-507(-)
MSELPIIDTVGYVGGILIAFALFPQIIQIHKTRSTKDISYWWQLVYFCGLILVLIYTVQKNLWPVLWPLLVELFFVCYLIFLKAVIDIETKNCIVELQEGRSHDDCSKDDEELGYASNHQ